jgi:DNA-binding CsgD family transcriptional regulator
MVVLSAALDSCAGGRAQSLFFEGAAGTSKSTLLAWARADARRRGWAVLPGRASVLEAANDFGVLRQLLAALPPLPDGRPAAALGPVPEDSSPFEVFERVSAHLLDAASRDPVLIAVDDLQWCDASSLRWLAYLANRSTGLPIALVLAGSPWELSEHRFMVDELVASCERHPLDRLTKTQLRRWVADVLGAPPDDAFVEGCFEATGGNGALLAALLPALAARPVPPAEGSLNLLESVGIAAVSRRVMPWIKRGGPEALAVAQAVAILDDDSYPVLVARLAGLSPHGASRTIDQLIKLDILSDTSPLRFVHSLTRAVVNMEISAGLHTSLRLRASRIVRDRHTEPERAAAHLMAVDLAGDPDALPMLRAAASFARDGGRPGPALRYLRRALAEPMSNSTRAGVLAEIGAVEAGLGIASSGSTLRQALSLAADPSLRVRIAVDLAYADAAAGNPLRPAVEIVDEAHAHLPPDELAAEAEFGVFLAYADSADASEFFSQRLPRLRELAGDDPRLAALAGTVDAWSDTRRGRDRAGCVSRALSALRAIDRRSSWEPRLRWPTVSTLIDAEEYGLAETGGRFAHRQGPAGDSALSAYLRGRLAHGRGDLEAARAELETALTNPSAAGTTGVARLVQVLIDLGELDAADRLISRDVPTAPTSPAWAAAALTFAQASLSMARNQHREALLGFLEAGRTLAALGIDNPSVLHWRSQAARCHAMLGDVAAATSLAAEEVTLARSWGTPRALSTALAAAGLVTLDLDTALEAVTVLEGTDAASHRAAALVDLGVVHWETGDADQAHGHLQAGYALARMIGAKPTWLRAARYLKHAGGRPDLGRISGVSALTAQERAVAELAATGATNRQIADEMVLTQRTVEQYLTSAYRKLGITGRSQLATALPR